MTLDCVTRTSIIRKIREVASRNSLDIVSGQAGGTKCKQTLAKKYSYDFVRQNLKSEPWHSYEIPTTTGKRHKVELFRTYCIDGEMDCLSYVITTKTPLQGARKPCLR